MHPNKCCTMILTNTCLSICDGRQCQLSILASNQKTALKCNAQTTESTRKWAKIRRNCSDTNRYLKEPSHLADPIPQLSKSSTPHSRKPVALGQWRDIADEQSKNASPPWDPHTHTQTTRILLQIDFTKRTVARYAHWFGVWDIQHPLPTSTTVAVTSSEANTPHLCFRFPSINRRHAIRAQQSNDFC